jgi:hypothetical protein
MATGRASARGATASTPRRPGARAAAAAKGAAARRAGDGEAARGDAEHEHRDDHGERVRGSPEHELADAHGDRLERQDREAVQERRAVQAPRRETLSLVTGSDRREGDGLARAAQSAREREECDGDGEVDECRPAYSRRESVRRNQMKTGEEHSRDRSGRVHRIHRGVRARHALAHTGEAPRQERDRRTHQHGRRADQHARHGEALERQTPGMLEAPGARDRLDAAEPAREGQAPEADERFEGRVGPERVANPERQAATQ